MADGILPASENDMTGSSSTEFEDPELLEIQKSYLREVGDQIAILRFQSENLSSGKLFKTAFPVLLYISHQLKGSGGMLGFPEISEVAKEMNAELNNFMDDASPRPARGDLSSNLLDAVARLEHVVESERSRISKP